MFRCSNDPMFQCSNVQIFKCSNVQMFKCSNVHAPVFLASNVFCNLAHRDWQVKWNLNEHGIAFSFITFVDEESCSPFVKFIARQKDKITLLYNFTLETKSLPWGQMQSPALHLALLGHPPWFHSIIYPVYLSIFQDIFVRL